MGNVYRSLGQSDKARKHLKQSLLILEEIKSPNAEIVRKNLTELETR